MEEDGGMAAAEPVDDVSTLITSGRDREAALRGAGIDGASLPPEDDGGSIGALAQFAELGPVLGNVIAGIRPEHLDLATPCSEFTVQGVLEHMIGGATVFAAAYRGDAAVEPAIEDPITGIQAALGDLADSIAAPGALERTIHAPFGEVDGESFARFIVLDGLIHGWDLAIATGRSYDPPEQLVVAAAAYARQVLDPLRDGRTFAAAVAPAPDASPIEELAAYTGRTNQRRGDDLDDLTR
jgi:uncharacterized protein (TIGR03086 family)